MKNKIMIIENNYYKFFSTKSLLEAKYKIKVDVITATCTADCMKVQQEIKPGSVITSTSDGIIDLVKTMEKKNVNKRNTEIYLLITPESVNYTAEKRRKQALAA